ncbi:MAG: spore germination protein [Thermoanaerobacteraceae bacterium]|nr:spore germination protein [Thermoanaerobacteraceae bacterium]
MKRTFHKSIEGLDDKGQIEKLDKREIQTMSKDLEQNLLLIKDRFKDCYDIVIREFYIDNGHTPNHKLALIYIDNMIDKSLINESIMESLMSISKHDELEYNGGKQLFSRIKERLITASHVDETDDFEKVIYSILCGNSALLMDKLGKCLIIYSIGWEKRAIEEPATEMALRGSHDGFTEAFGTNVSLIRRRIKDTALKLKVYKIGRYTNTTVGIMFVEGIVNPKIIEELEGRIKKIDIDGILESGYIEQLIADNWLSPFPQFKRTERPDTACASLLEGNIIIITDNTPYVLIAPTTFFSLFQSMDDYTEGWQISTFLRVLRFIAILIAIDMPALYVSVTAFHPDMLPTDLAFSIAATREGVPFSSPIEALMMLLTLEVLREAGIRLPAPFGQTIGIVGSIVLGEAAVRAGVASPIMVIIVSLNAISSFVIPNFSLAIGFRLLAFIFLLLSSIAGLYGVLIGLIALIVHLVRLKSVGVNYLSPFINFKSIEARDTLYRAPLHFLTERPKYTMPVNKKRLKNPYNRENKGE